ncbi:hypothetical protein Cgig2_004629 [Carnegiea gigantea]|uniref:Transmembrane protein n=1 Tax=Carnegiea gigantea TaxID=171969 RepID=A0A9Q1JT74_9CARY|nr:hypothetical protein Cgig2_004629 [Carnegiea gigantea]
MCADGGPPALNQARCDLVRVDQSLLHGPEMHSKMGTPHRSGALKRSNDSARLIITTITGIVFGFFVGVSFPSASLAKIRLSSRVMSTFDGAFADSNISGGKSLEDLGSTAVPKYEPESDEKERARYQPRVQMAHRRSKRQDQDHLRAVLETESRKQSAGEIPASLRSPEKSPETDMPAGTDTADQPSPHFGRGETHPPETDLRKLTRCTRKSGNVSNRRPVKGYWRLPET